MFDLLESCSEGNVYCTFCLGERWFGVDARWVKEISTQSAFTPILHAPAVVQGFVNLRGHLFLVLNLRDLLAPEAIPHAGPGQLIVFKPAAGESFALYVDRVGDIAHFPAEDMDVSRSEEDVAVRQGSGTRLVELVAGVAKRSEGLVTIVDPRQFLATVATDHPMPTASNRVPTCH
ncbi:MAG: chemotaxis protein CheW [Pirellulaceae bacterium]